MKISDIEIPDADIEKLSNKLKRMLYVLYEADGAVTTWSLLKAGGAGVAQRRRELREWLAKYGLVLNKDFFGKKNSVVFMYWIQAADMLPIRPKQVIGEIA